MKAFIISAIEWLVLQTDNDLDDKILAKVKSAMRLGVVWLNFWESGKGFNTLTQCKIHIYGFVVIWLKTLTEQCETKWSPTEDQIDNIIIPAMRRTAQQYAKYASELQCPPSFIALMLRDIADTFEENAIAGEKGCDCC